MGAIDFADLNWERRAYRAMPAYAQSKLANLLFTSELQRRLDDVGSPVRAVAAHPGMAATNLLRPEGRRLRDRLQRAVTGLLAQSDEDGAQSTLYAATGDIPGGTRLPGAGRPLGEGARRRCGASALAGLRGTDRGRVPLRSEPAAGSGP